nr:MAG: hypothetical protein 2 [Byreldi virus]
MRKSILQLIWLLSICSWASSEENDVLSCVTGLGDCNFSANTINIDVKERTFVIKPNKPQHDCRQIYLLSESVDDIFCEKNGRFIDCTHCFHPRFLRSVSLKKTNGLQMSDLSSHKCPLIVSKIAKCEHSLFAETGIFVFSLILAVIFHCLKSREGLVSHSLLLKIFILYLLASTIFSASISHCINDAISK